MKLGFFTKLAVKTALTFARKYATPELLIDEARKGLDLVASKAHAASGSTQEILNRSKIVCEIAADGKVDAEETTRLLGDVITQSNIDQAFNYLENKLLG